MKFKINKGKSRLTPKGIRTVEKNYNAKYVSDLSLLQENGWTKSHVPVFWQETLSDPSHSHYFGIYKKDEKTYICDASSAIVPISGLVGKNGEFVYSRSLHDFREDSENTVSVDGGREYGRYSYSGTYVSITANIIDGKFLFQGIDLTGWYVVPIAERWKLDKHEYVSEKDIQLEQEIKEWVDTSIRGSNKLLIGNAGFFKNKKHAALFKLFWG